MEFVPQDFLYYGCELLEKLEEHKKEKKIKKELKLKKFKKELNQKMNEDLKNKNPFD